MLDRWRRWRLYRRVYLTLVCQHMDAGYRVSPAQDRQFRAWAREAAYGEPQQEEVTDMSSGSRRDPATGRKQRDKGPVAERRGPRPERRNGAIVPRGRLAHQRNKKK